MNLVKTLGEVCEKPQYGWTTSASAVGEVQLLRTTDITKGKINWSSVPFCRDAPPDLSKFLLADGDIVVSRAGSVGASILVDNPNNAVFASYLIRLRPHRLNRRYLAYFLQSPQYWSQIADHSVGIAIPNVNATKLASVRLPVPDEPQQREIVDEIEKQFSRLDAGVEALKRVQSNLRRYRASVLKAACEGRLVPTEATRARKEGGTYETGVQLLTRMLEVRRASWSGRGKYKEPPSPEIGGLPPLPEGWAWTSIDQLMLNITDGDHQPPPQSASGVPFLVIGNVRNGVLSFTNTRFVSDDYAANVEPFRKPRKGDILYTLVGSFGIPAEVTSDQEFCVQRHIGVLRPHASSPTNYLKHILSCSFVYQQAAMVATGTAQKTVPLAGLRRIAIPLPPASEQDRIVEEVERLLSIAEASEIAAEANISRSRSLRGTILQAAFEGARE